MQMEELEKQLLKYGAQKDISNLQKLIFACSEDKLEKVIQKLLTNSVFPKLWNLLLKAFQDTKNCHEKRIKMIFTILSEMETRQTISSDVCSKLVQRLCMDLVKLKTEHLVEVCNFCLNSIQSKQTTLSSWRDLLPDTIRILSEKDLVSFNELEYSGQEFKSIFITTICLINWSPEKITQLAAMFSDMSLQKEEHLKVVIKLASSMEKLIPQEVPPFVYQLLTLCRHQNGRIIFVKLQHYFELRIYNKTNFWNSNISESSPDLDVIESAEDHEALDAESMVLFHIQSAAALGHNCIKDYLNSLKQAEKSPDFILHPFQILVLFAISTSVQYEEAALDIMRHSVVRFYTEQNKRGLSYWYREIIPASTEPEKMFTQIMDRDREVLLEAFSNFGFKLLSVGSALGRDTIAEKQWKLGTMVLLKILKKKRCITPILLKTICNHILTRHSSTQFIDCLYYLSKTCPLLLIENQSCILEMVESLIQISNEISFPLIDALMPLTKVSSTIRDQFILILRKCLYSRSIETRQVAVYGYVKLISTLDISGGGSLSQNSMGSFSSGYSIYTQISLNRTSQVANSSRFGSEAICWEVLGILKRSFMQQAEVKLELYDDLYNVVCVNPDLAIPILDMLWFHLMEFYVLDEDINPPLNFNSATILRDMDCILQEPLGNFVFAISQVVIKVKQLEDEKDVDVMRKYSDILDSLCRRMPNCELEHFNLDDGSDLTEYLPESQQKLHVLREVINVFEALIGYQIATLSTDGENQCGIIDRLFQGYSRFLNFGKNILKPRKGKKNNKSAQKENNSTEQSYTQTNATSKGESERKFCSRTFKLPDSLLNLSIVDKGLKTLLEPNIPWVSVNDASLLRSKTEVHRHFIQVALLLIGKYKTHKGIDTAYRKSDYDEITSIAETLYNKVICRLNDYIDFDCTSAILSIECFCNILVLINSHFKRNLVSFLSKIGGGRDKTDSLISHLKPMLEMFEQLFEKDEDELSTDPEIKKYHAAIVGNISTLCGFIPNDNNSLSLQVYEWMKQIAYNNSIPTKVAGSFMTLFCDLHVRYKSGLALLEHTSNSFSNVYGMVKDDDSIIETDESLQIVNASTANLIILSISSCIKTILDDIENVVARIKSDWHILNYPGEDDIKKKEDLRSKEKGVSCQLCFVSKILTNLLKLALPSGSISDAIFKNIVQFYSSVSCLTKYFIGRSAQGSNTFQGGWFEKLIKLVGKRLAPAIYDFVCHLEAGQKEDEHTQGSKKKSEGTALKNKVLRETKAIPKVIYEIEQFSKYVMQLSKKIKLDLSKYVGQGTSRDFRIFLQSIHDDLKKANAKESTQQSADSEVNSSRDDSVSTTESEVESGNEGNGDSALPTPRKRAKIANGK